MANIKISALPSASAITSDDIFPVVDNPTAGVTKKATAQVLLNYITSSTINGLTVTVLTGSTTTGSLALFTTVTGSTVTGSTARFTTISGSTITGSTSRFTTISGSTVTGSTALFTSITGSHFGSGAGLTSIPNGALVSSTVTIGTTSVSLGSSATTIQGVTVLTGSTITGSTALFTSITGAHSGSGAGLTNIPNAALVNSAITVGTTGISLGSSATTIQGVTVLTGSTVTGSTALFTTISASSVTGSTARFTTITGSTITGSTALFTSITGTHSGSGIGLTNIPNGALVNSTVTIGTTSVSLGSSATTVQGVTVLTGSTVTGSTALFTTISASNAYIDQKIGVGVPSPAQRLHISGNIRLGTGDENVLVAGDADLALAGDSDVLIVSDFNSTSGTPGGDIIFGAGSAINSASASYAQYFPSANPRLTYATIKGNTGRVGIGTNTPSSLLHVNGGDATISNGNLIFATAGKGIDFSITPDSGTATPVELLDDYEEGTWTPELSGTDCVFPNQTNYGSYTKIGNQVTAVYRITVSSSGNTFGTSSLVIKGWPFKSTNASSVYYTSPIYIGNLSTNGTGSTGYTSVLTNNDITSSLYKRSLTGNTTATVKGNDLSGSAFLQSTLIYFTDD